MDGTVKKKRIGLVGSHTTAMLAGCISLVADALHNAEMYKHYEPETVKGNSRQKRIVGGRHSWPEAKRRGKR